MRAPPKLAVAGLGNLLLTDDGIGVYLIRALQKMKLPENLVLFETGTALFSLHTVALEYKNLLLVDAVRSGGKPGTVYRLNPEDALLLHSQADRASILSLHDFRLPCLLSRPGTAPLCWRIFGVEPHTVDYGTGLSPLLSGLLPALAATLKQEAEEMLLRLSKAPSPLVGEGRGGALDMCV